MVSMSGSDTCVDVPSPCEGVPQEMSIQICRGCLSVDAITPVDSSLSQAFTQATGVQWDHECLPRVLCVLCKALVKKCHTFRETAKRVNDVLKQLMISNELNLININMIRQSQLRIKPLLEPRHYPPNHCDLYQADVQNEENTSILENNDTHYEIPFVVAERNFKDILKSLKNESIDPIDEDNLHNEEFDQGTIIIDEEDVKGHGIEENTQTVTNIPEFTYSDSYAKIRQKAKSKRSFRREQHSPPNSRKSPKRELLVTFEKDHCFEDEKDVKVTDLVDVMMAADGTPDLSREPARKKKLKLKEDRKSKQKNKEIIKNPAKLFTKFKIESASSCDNKRSKKGSKSLLAGEKRYACDYCGYKFADSRDLTRHIRSHTGEKPYACDICDFKCSQAQNLKSHKRTHLVTGSAPSTSTVIVAPVRKKYTFTKRNIFICNKCNLKFKSEVILAEHESRCDGPRNITIYNNKSTKDSKLRKGEEKRYVCNYCGNKFSESRDLIIHIRTHTGEKPYACNICGHKCSQLYNLKKHMTTHTKRKDFVCNNCNLYFKSNEQLLEHISKCDGSAKDIKFLSVIEKLYECDYCDFKSLHRTSLIEHIRSHTGEKPYVCDFCGYKSARKNSLNGHLRTHTGEKPYVCSVCDRKFALPGGLKTHMRIHTGEKPHSCNICSFKFIQARHLHDHMRTHTGEKPHACNVCGLKFSRIQHVKTHMRTHTGEKPYACTFCEKKFAVSYNLKSHIRTHTGEKPYVCNYCDYKCERRKAFIVHLKTHTA